MEQVKRIIIKRDERFKETNDCTVMALSSAYGMPYRKAHKALRRCGRVNGMGFTIERVLDREKAFGKTTELIQIAKRGKQKPMTQAEFAKAYPQGDFILRFRLHVASCKDGVIYDNQNHSWKIYYAYRISDKKL